MKGRCRYGGRRWWRALVCRSRGKGQSVNPPGRLSCCLQYPSTPTHTISLYQCRQRAKGGPEGRPFLAGRRTGSVHAHPYPYQCRQRAKGVPEGRPLLAEERARLVDVGHVRGVAPLMKQGHQSSAATAQLHAHTTSGGEERGGKEVSWFSGLHTHTHTSEGGGEEKRMSAQWCGAVLPSCMHVI